MRAMLPEQSNRDDLVNPPQDARVDAAVRALLNLCAHYMPSADLAMVRRAFEFAESKHRGVTRQSGEPYILHPLAVASYVAELALDAHGVAAALLHDTIEDTKTSAAELAAEFGPAVSGIVEGVTKFTQAETAPENGSDPPLPRILSAEEYAERKRFQRLATLRKLLLAMQDDPRVLLVKLADRLHNLRTLDSMNDRQRERTSRETLDVYGPLAGRAGLYAIKNELEDLAFSYLEPITCARIQAQIAAAVAKRRSWAPRVCERLQRELRRHGICAVVNWRVKHPLRAYYEAGKEGVKVGQLTDLLAFRVLVLEKADCYRSLSVIHGKWRPIKYDDYIAHAKSNGYQSFHTLVFNLEGHDAKLHIRTHEMHRATQHGIAEYWLERAARGEYVDGSSAHDMRALVGWVSEFVELDGELGEDPTEFMKTIERDYFKDQIFIQTPKGDTLELPEGATVLDAAYKIHTNIGDHTVGATIQSADQYGALRQRIVGPEYLLSRGAVVHVRTSRDVQPEPSWLGIAQTEYARIKINRALRLQQRLREATGPGAPSLGGPLAHPSGKAARAALARCCCPCPGDKLLGVAQQGNLVTLHRACCRHLQITLARRRANGSPYAEAIPTAWPQINVESYRAPLLISSQDHRGLVQEISAAASLLGLNVSHINAHANTSCNRATIAITLDIPRKIGLDYVSGRLRKVPGILRVWRDLGRGCFENPS
jgi:guanosine-3',5'-bis(diphosphate) 3'-pyrophosphohydrolase